MKHRPLWVAATIIALCIVGGFFLTAPHTTRDAAPSNRSQESAPPRVTLTDTYKKGNHMLSGSVVAANACTTLTASSSLADGVMRLDLTTVVSPGVCLQVPTPVLFAQTLAAPASAGVVVTVNGTVASTSAP